MKELAGGLWLAGLIAWALFGLIPGIILICIGWIAGAGSWIYTLEKEKQAASWRSQYPSYKY